MFDEVWAEIPCYEGLYEVSNGGTVRNAITKHVLKPSKTGGYSRVKLYKHINGQRLIKTFMVHRLVAQAFLENLENKPQVNHIDGNKSNNTADNLEWCTATENMRHSVVAGLRDMSCCTNVTKKAVVQCDCDGKRIKVWESLSAASRALNIPIANISHCCAGRIKRAGGYKWILEI